MAVHHDFQIWYTLINQFQSPELFSQKQKGFHVPSEVKKSLCKIHIEQSGGHGIGGTLRHPIDLIDLVEALLYGWRHQLLEVRVRCDLLDLPPIFLQSYYDYAVPYICTYVCIVCMYVLHASTYM